MKRTEGLVTLIVSNPSKRPVTPSPDVTVAAAAVPVDTAPIANNVAKASLPPSRAVTPVPGNRPDDAPSPQPPHLGFGLVTETIDPATCGIAAGRECTIEVVTDNKGLGVFFVGGTDTLISVARPASGHERRLKLQNLCCCRARLL